MNNTRTRLMAISGTTLALIVAGTAAVAAHPGDREGQRGFGNGRGGAQLERGLRGGLGQRGFGDRFEGFVRSETTIVGDDGTVTQRIDNGTVDSSSDAGLDYSLSTGETASVSTDEDTQIVAFEEQTVERFGGSRTRLVPQEVALTDITAGSEVTIWADSEDGESFVAQRILVRPETAEASEDTMDDADADADAAADADADAAADADAEAPAVDDAAIAPAIDA